jgi:hypothetical protein
VSENYRNLHLFERTFLLIRFVCLGSRIPA